LHGHRLDYVLPYQWKELLIFIQFKDVSTFIFIKLFCLLYYLCTDVFQEDETCLSTYNQDAWITAIAWSGISIKNSYNFDPQYLLIGGVDGSVNIAIVDSPNKIMYEKLDNFCRLGGLCTNHVPNVLYFILIVIHTQNR